MLSKHFLNIGNSSVLVETSGTMLCCTLSLVPFVFCLNLEALFPVHLDFLANPIFFHWVLKNEGCAFHALVTSKGPRHRQWGMEPQQMFEDATQDGTALCVLVVVCLLNDNIKETCLLMKQFSLLEITSTCSAASCVVADLSGVFHAVDSSCTSSCPQVHTCS